jgi:hypothetical protein
MLTDLFAAAPAECKHDIYFLPNEAGEQKNECRDLLLAYLAKPSKPHGLKLAQRLQSVLRWRGWRIPIGTPRTHDRGGGRGGAFDPRVAKDFL